MGKVLLFFGGVLGLFVVVVLMGIGRPPTAASPSNDRLEAARTAILEYRACEGGMTITEATALSLQASRVQEIRGNRYVDHNSERAKYAIFYKAANGAEKQVTYGYQFATGRVGAEDDTAAAVLRMMESGCR